jgi:putative flippase GtrA
VRLVRESSSGISPKTRKELLRFLLVGGIAVAIDAVVYAVLQRQGISPSWAKRCSFIAGSIWAFFMNKFYTFEQKQLKASEPIIFTAVYVAGWLLNSLFHDLVLAWAGVKSLAFVVATGVSTCTNFAGQKWLVFRGLQKAAC